MRRLATALLALGLLLLAVAPTAAAPPSPENPAGHGKALGVVPARGQAGRPGSASNLSYHNGPVMRTNTVGRVRSPEGWQFDFGIADADRLVHASVKELAERLPPAERQHWSHYLLAQPVSRNFLSIRVAPGSCFDDGDTAKMTPTSASCYSCHADHGAVDTTFVQFYPTLLPIAKSKGTLSASYLKELPVPAQKQ